MMCLLIWPPTSLKYGPRSFGRNSRGAQQARLDAGDLADHSAKGDQSQITKIRSSKRMKIFDQVGGFLGGQVGQLSVGHQRDPRRPELLHIFGREDALLALAVPQHHPSLVPLDQQACQRTAVGRRGDISGVPRLDPARRLQEALQQVLSRTELPDRR